MTSASCSISLIWCSTGANCPAQRLIGSPTVPSLICTPNRSLMTSQARASGSSWCCVRYTAIAPMVRYRCSERDDETGLTEQQLGEIPIPDGPQYLSLPPGETVYVTTRQGIVDAVDIRTRAVKQLLTGGVFGPMDY